MGIKVGINGFGRIGRQVLKAINEYHADELEVVAVNDLFDTKTNAHLFKYDSNYGIVPGHVEAKENELIIDGNRSRSSLKRTLVYCHGRILASTLSSNQPVLSPTQMAILRKARLEPAFTLKKAVLRRSSSAHQPRMKTSPWCLVLMMTGTIVQNITSSPMLRAPQTALPLLPR